MGLGYDTENLAPSVPSSQSHRTEVRYRLTLSTPVMDTLECKVTDLALIEVIRHNHPFFRVIHRHPELQHQWLNLTDRTLTPVIGIINLNNLLGWRGWPILRYGFLTHSGSWDSKRHGYSGGLDKIA